MSRSTKSKKIERPEKRQTENQPSADQPESASEPMREEIEQRAYEIYVARGGADGNDQDDWLQAERGLSDNASKSKANDV